MNTAGLIQVHIDSVEAAFVFPDTERCGGGAAPLNPSLVLARALPSFGRLSL